MHAASTRLTPCCSSSLQAMRSRQPDAKFMTVSGDLIAHSFSCRYTTLLPGSTQSDYQAFVLKTLSFVMGELRASFPGVPVYVALGNNDTACGDYRLDAGSDFLARTGRIVAEGLPPSQQQQALKVFAKGGYYSLTMAAPMRDTRLIVVNDLFLSPKIHAPVPADPTPLRPLRKWHGCRNSWQRRGDWVKGSGSWVTSRRASIRTRRLQRSRISAGTRRLKCFYPRTSWPIC